MHTAFGPQGEGLQGSTGFDDSSIAKFNNIKKRKEKKRNCIILIINIKKKIEKSIKFLRKFLTFEVTIIERISCESFRTCASWCMINHVTDSWWSTGTWTRISTSLVYASLITSTIGIDSTFGSTIWWTTDIGFKTRTRWHTTDIMTFCVWSTRWRYAGILNDRTRCKF